MATFFEKNVLITGASSGIGMEIANKLANTKCNLFLAARRVEILEKIASDNKNMPANIYPIECDVSDKESVSKAYARIKENAGYIDIAILNSGISHRTDKLDYDSSVAQEIFNVNIMGLVHFIEVLLPDYKSRRSGIIAGVSSLADKRGFSKSGFYCASKAAATLILESLRVELKNYNVKVITIKPGFVKTPMTDKNKFKMPLLIPASKAADIIVKGIEKEKSIIEFPLMTAIGSKLLRIMPDFIFDTIADKAK
ncbi:MAG: SDR family NAD(P)-dependent oxidoreductase [Bacteroidota bacterium]|nr:SDR family NAD(P)-dependent oxidoreductase [Bacteroidota bacterium]